MANKLQSRLDRNEIDLCADISEQSVNFANWLHSEYMEETTFKLLLTPEVLNAIKNTKNKQEAVLKLKAIDWADLNNTYINI